MKKPKTFFIRTYGCQMNELDSEIMIGKLEKWGVRRVYDEKEGDLLIFNTCSVRDLAERKVMGKIGQLGRSKKKEQIIGVTGCMAMTKKHSLFQKLPHIDFVLGTNNIDDLIPLLNDLIASKEKQCRTDDSFQKHPDYLIAKRDDALKAHVSIIRGCNKYCTYCIVPYTRGREISRPFQDIEEECQKLADKGYKEIMLLGQNVNSYGKDQPEWKTLFHDLLYRLDKIEGIERIRFMTSHPIDITIALMQAIRDLPSLCEFVHFPLQSGSNRILKKMHRIYTKEEYLEKVHLLRETVPNVELGTDIIVGFPTETDEEFEETYELFRAIRYSAAFLFLYSPRKGTPAMRWRDDIPKEVKEERHQRLLALHEQICLRQQQEMIGREVEVLVEGRNKEGLLKGRTRCWKKAIFSGEESLIGTIQPIKIHSFNHQTLLGSAGIPA